jgi:hypothetical protein
MKNFSIFSTVLLMLSACTLQAQTDLQNTGTLYLSGSSDILYISGSFANSSASALTNNGNLYVLQNLANDQASITVGTGTLYFNGSALQTVSGAQVFKTFNLVTNNTGGFLLNNDLSVTGVHTFTAGVINSSATPNYLMYEAGSSYSGDGDSKHVKGWVRKTGTTAFTFPVGNGTVERTIAVSSLSVSSVFNTNYGGATTNPSNVAAPLVTVDVNEYWNLNKVSGGSAIVNMNWDNSKIPMRPFVLADIRVANYISSNWTQEGGSATGNVATTGAISSNSIASFGPFTFGSITFALPVTLAQLSAYNNNGKAVVDWTTTDEINVGFYDVQRSDDGISFYSIGNVAARNQQGLQQYELADTKALGAVTYYRLSSVDEDGKTKLSQVITVNNGNLLDKYITVANPAHGSLRINVQHMNGEFAYSISTVSGQTIQNGTMQVSASGVHEIQLSSSIKMGIYVLEIQKAGYNFSQKVIIQ